MSLEDHNHFHPLESPNRDEWVIPVIDPGPGIPIVSQSIGIVVGGNLAANVIDARIYASPGLNYSWELWTVNLYDAPWEQ